jgi:small subunit ribosomal protein S17
MEKELEITTQDNEGKEPESQTAENLGANAQKESKQVVKTGHRRILEGKVVSNKANKTIVVRIERYVQHPLYKKYYKKSKKVMAHDESNECKIGDVVRVMEYRPLSKRKRWILKEIVERAK